MQVVGYRRTGREDGPALVLATDGEVESLALSTGRELAFALGERHCAGTVVEDRHRACPDPAAPYCDRHTDRWPCARCTGDCDRPIENCHREHVVYLAAFAPDHHKVGVTKTGRLETRLREQGADRAAHVRTVEDGRIARRVEAEIAARVPDRVRVPTKVAGLHREVDEHAWNDLLTAFEPLETFDFDYDLDLSDAPIPETTATGTVVGVQGRVLVLEDGGTNYAVDMRDLLGHELEAGRTDRQRQSSLGSFS